MTGEQFGGVMLKVGAVRESGEDLMRLNERFGGTSKVISTVHFMFLPISLQ
jgi:hypothetical protein